MCDRSRCEHEDTGRSCDSLVCETLCDLCGGTIPLVCLVDLFCSLGAKGDVLLDEGVWKGGGRARVRWGDLETGLDARESGSTRFRVVVRDGEDGRGTRGGLAPVAVVRGHVVDRREKQKEKRHDADERRGSERASLVAPTRERGVDKLEVIRREKTWKKTVRRGRRRWARLRRWRMFFLAASPGPKGHVSRRPWSHDDCRLGR